MDDYLKKTIDLYDKIASSYAVDMVTFTPDLEREKFIHCVIKGGSILDVGCAAGRGQYFYSKGF